ncbi:uncharacterized protein LOC122278556 [Carya illinoinensis]|uniref:uncharacterized protein LOC122278556 n=1 Tax=Carya illinoinensis TaxID=32201 RepID=UPI001C71B706|nr:uncharacterized protein LOC122278556 [Carya illinoinensis]
MRSNLERNFTAKEVDVALKQMSPFKSPGPDGYSVGFYQEHWKIVGQDVSSAVMEFLNSGVMPWSLNHTHLVLIPKAHHRQYNGGIRAVTHHAFKKKGREGSMAIKLDMSKAYDRVEWNFLEAILIKLGFGIKWTNLLMNCVRTVTYSTILNGIPGERDIIKGVAVSRNGIRINHLLFADDCAIFCRAKLVEWYQIKGLLSVYEEASGQTLNKEKTRNEILIKSVLQAIPAYAMSVFKMPGKLLKESEAIIAKFWWNQKEVGKGIHWKSWSSMGTVKNQGGLGFRDFNSFNRTLLAKQLWRMIKEPLTLVSRVYKEK